MPKYAGPCWVGKFKSACPGYLLITCKCTSWGLAALGMYWIQKCTQGKLPLIRKCTQGSQPRVQICARPGSKKWPRAGCPRYIGRSDYDLIKCLLCCKVSQHCWQTLPQTLKVLVFDGSLTGWAVATHTPHRLDSGVASWRKWSAPRIQKMYDNSQQSIWHLSLMCVSLVARIMMKSGL